MSAVTREQMAEWVAAWKRAGPAMEELRHEELRRLSQSESAHIFDGMDCLFPKVPGDSSGLVEQQRLFRKLHGRQPA